MSSQDTSSTPTKPPTVYDHIAVMTEQMATVAWQKLGLQPDLMTGQMEKNLSEAKIAIDLTTHLASFLEPELDEADKRELHNLVRNLRINYVEQSKGASE